MRNAISLVVAALAATADYHFEFEVFDSGGLNGVVVSDGTITLFANVVNA